MKIIVAPNAFKHSLSAQKAANAIAQGILAVHPQAEIKQIPVADGGDGLIEVIKLQLAGEIITCQVTGPDFTPVTAQYLYIKQTSTAIIESASCAGLALLRPEQFSATTTTSRGVGELIQDAIAKDAKNIVIGLGGTACCDAGIGLVSALGVNFLDNDNNIITPTGENLLKIRKIDLNQLRQTIKDVKFTAVCDVTNPLTGLNGAAHVFAPQKGASPADVVFLEQGLCHFVELVKTSGLCSNLAEVSRGGAAGGMGAALHAFVSAELVAGIDFVLDILDFSKHLTGAKLVITGEGKIDSQTINGKAPAGVAKMAKIQSIPCLVIAGSVDASVRELQSMGIDAALSLCNSPMSLQNALEQAEQFLRQTASQVFATFFAGYTHYTTLNLKPGK